MLFIHLHQHSDGRTPLHEIAARGGAPTVLLLASEPESEQVGDNGKKGSAVEAIAAVIGGSSSSQTTTTNDSTIEDGYSDTGSSGRGGGEWDGEGDILEDRGGNGTTKTSEGSNTSSDGEYNGLPDTRKHGVRASASPLWAVTSNKHPNETPSTTPAESTAEIPLASPNASIATAEVGVDSAVVDVPTRTPTAGDCKQTPSAKTIAPSLSSTIRTPRPCSTFAAPALSDSEDELTRNGWRSDHGTDVQNGEVSP